MSRHHIWSEEETALYNAAEEHPELYEPVDGPGIRDRWGMTGAEWWGGLAAIVLLTGVAAMVAWVLWLYISA